MVNTDFLLSEMDSVITTRYTHAYESVCCREISCRA